MRIKTLLCLLLVIGLSFRVMPIARADGEVQTGGGQNGVVNYRHTPAELAHLAAKDKLARAHVKNLRVGAASSQYLNVGPAELYREPNDYDHRNYCGPSATRVAIRARTTNVPGLETVAVAEHLTKTNGVYIWKIADYINKTLNMGWYEYAASNNSGQFSSWAQLDVYYNYALITGVVTNGMPGWITTANHIVTVYGYNTANGTSISYVDTGSEIAGHKYSKGGRYFNTKDLATFYQWVFYYNQQIW
ncbi:MAG: hypothetical protein WA821_17230 [Anaerolineales bacterium]